jgi:Ca2+-binding EF-hand superfamily protein
MKDYVRVLMHTFDSDSDGFISFEELVGGLRSLKINLTSQEKQSLMRRLDFNQDGKISEDEIYKVFAPYDSKKQSQASRSGAISPGKISL